MFYVIVCSSYVFVQIKFINNVVCHCSNYVLVQIKFINECCIIACSNCALVQVIHFSGFAVSYNLHVDFVLLCYRLLSFSVLSAVYNVCKECIQRSHPFIGIRVVQSFTILLI